MSGHGSNMHSTVDGHSCGGRCKFVPFISIPELPMSALAKSQKAKAEDFLSQAEVLMAKRSWFSSKERNQEEASECLLQAANAYKVGGLAEEAGKTYLKVAELNRDSLNNPNEAAKAFTQAGTVGYVMLGKNLTSYTGHSFKKNNSVDAITAYQSAVSLLTDAGRLTQAAKLCKECAELYEQEDGEVSGAIELYEQAAELFALEESKSATSTCKAKVAELCSAGLDPPDLLKAFQLYDELGRNSLESNLLKFHAKGFFLQAILCQLANSDAVGAEQSLSTYEAVDYTFSESREGKFATQLVETVNGMDVEGFSTACFEYDRISKLDPWKTSMLVKVKRSIDDGDGADGEEDVDLT